jgi:hypothetical protein
MEDATCSRMWSGGAARSWTSQPGLARSRMGRHDEGDALGSRSQSHVHKMRNPVACISCRTAKQRCLNNQDSQPCDRCKSTGRAELCEYPPPGTSAMHRKPKRPRPSEDAPETTPDSGAPATNGSGAQQTLFRRHDAGVPNGFSNAASSPNAASLSLLDGLDPFELLTDEVKNSYLRCSYKWSFHHTPTLLLRIRDRTLEPWMAWAMLALAIRYVVLQLCTHGQRANQTASSKSPRRRSARRLRPAMPTPPTPARSCSRTSRRRASAACRRCSC